MRFTIDDKHLITWMWVKKLRRKTLAQDVFDRSWNLDGVKTLIKKYQYEIFNFLDLCCGVGIVWSTTTRTRVSDVTAVTFSVKCFNPWKIYPVRKHLQKVFCFILFIYLRAFNKYLSPTVKPIAVTTLCWRPVHIAAIKIVFENNTNYFYAVRISISLAISWVFFSEHSVQVGYI